MRAARICGLEAGGKRRLYPASQKVGERKINFAIGALGHFPRVNKGKEGHPITQSTQTHRQVEWRLAASTGSTGNAFVAWKKSKSIITYFTATAALARSLRFHRRRGRNGAAAPWPQVPTCQMDSHQHKQLRLFVLLMKRSPRSDM